MPSQVIVNVTCVCHFDFVKTQFILVFPLMRACVFCLFFQRPSMAHRSEFMLVTRTIALLVSTTTLCDHLSFANLAFFFVAFDDHSMLSLTPSSYATALFCKCNLRCAHALRDVFEKASLLPSASSCCRSPSWLSSSAALPSEPR